MTDMPERVWVSPLGVFPVQMGGSISYVPESRALDAERERDAARACICTYCGYAMKYADNSANEVARVRDIMRDHDARCQRNPLLGEIAALHARVAALEAEREALAHAVLRYGWHDVDCPFLQDELPCTCDLEAIESTARALLSPEAP